MRKQIFLALGIFMAIAAFSQTVTITENFDGNNSTFTSYPASAWKTETNYYVSAHNSIRGVVPNMIGDSVVLTSRIYDLSNYNHVIFRFNHICKVSPMDITRVEYKIKQMEWRTLPISTYKGESTYLYGYNFSANTYPEWKTGDSLFLPLQSGWKEEVFDIGGEVGMDDEVQFRFVLKHGNISGTQISYGWLLDNVEILASNDEIYTPVVEFIEPLVKDTVYSTGPYLIRATVKSQTVTPIQTPQLIYIATNDQQVVTDTLLMTNIVGDSLWGTTIPQFIQGTKVVYSIIGKDMDENGKTITSGYIIIKPDEHYGDISAALTAIVSPIRGQTMGTITTPIEIFLRNKGDSALISATIYWSINGVIQPQPYSWTGNLLWEFEELISLENYMPRMESYDTILVWVNNPNGIIDPRQEDDTLSIITYGCATNMSGTYTVGQGGAFATMEDALNILSLCHPTGDITLALKSDIYTENWDLSNVGNFIGNHTLNITSIASDADSVILRPSSGRGILLDNSNNIKIENITVDVANNGTYGIELTGSCSNVVISHCNIFANTFETTVATAYAPIYKASNTGSLVNMSVTNCTIKGGYYGIYLYSESTNYYQDITIDRNIISDQYHYATYFYYINFNSVSYNQISPRSSNQGTIWYGLYFANIHNGGNIIGNKVRANNSGITGTLYGMSTYLVDNALVANNEIYLHSSALMTYGMYLYYSNGVDYLYNSVLLTGTGGATFRAAEIYVSIYALYNASYKNNIFVANGGTTPYAIYLSDAPNATTFAQYNDIDYNDYYSSGDLGFAGNILSDLKTWKSTVISDSNSINVYPEFINIHSDLSVSNYADILCQLTPPVVADINNNNRTEITTMGCYERPSVSLNGMPVRLLGLRDGSIINQTDSIRLVFFNGGNNPIISFNVEWSVNGVSNLAGGSTYTTSLSTGEFDTVSIGEITYTAGMMNIEVWINSLNGGLMDELHRDDTLHTTNFICNTMFSGTITVGVDKDFPTVNSALDMALLCGISGDITLVLDSGEYNENLNLTSINDVLGNHTLTITSANGKAEDVVLRPASGIAVLMGHTHNIRIEKITIDATQGSQGIQLRDTCSNIIIDHCMIYANPTSTNTTYGCVYKAENTGPLRDMQITNCTLSGGSYGIYLYGTSADYCQNITIDSNIITKQYQHGCYFYCVNLNSVSYNYVTPRTSNLGDTWYGLYFYYVNKGHITGNRIHTANSGANSSLYGLYVQNIDSALVNNNEINLTSSAMLLYGIHLYWSKDVEYLHNTVVVTGIGSCLMSIGGEISLATDSSYSATYKNNIFVSSGGSMVSYALLLSGTIDTTFVRYNHFDYNNYYSSGELAEAGSGVFVDLAAWKSAIPSDINSVSTSPNFIDITTHLQLSSYDMFYCNLLPSVGTDIQGYNRKPITTMGCYEEPTLNVNGTLYEIIGLRDGILIEGETDSVKVIFINKGSTPLHSVNLGWSINGISKTPKDYSFTTAVTEWQSDTITLGEITYLPGNEDIKIWINTLDGGSLTDEYPLNDTIDVSFFVCSNTGTVTGTIYVSDTSVFTTITDAIQVIMKCGTGDITLLLDSGTYEENVDFSDLNSNPQINTLMLTSKTNKAEDVVIKPLSGDGITIFKTYNLTVKAITVDVTSGLSSGILFTGTCSNIVVRDCRLLANPTAAGLAASFSAPVYRGVAIDGADSLYFINNLLDGGINGLHFRGGSGTSRYGRYIVFDSNTVSNQFECGIYAEYADFASFSCNTILSRTTNTGSTWTGIIMSLSNGDIVANRITQRSDAISSPYGINAFGYNCYPVPHNRGQITNNEILFKNISGSLERGIYIGQSKVEIVHNSIYNSSMYTIFPGLMYGIFLNNNNSGNNDIVIKNNNIVLTSSAAYPVYFSDTGNLHLYDIDYNNYYAPTYVGYYGGNITTLSAWQQIIPTDLHSIQRQPQFIDSSSHLELSTYTGFSCPLYSGVTRDIKGYLRNSVTMMGAYSGLGSAFDLSIQQVFFEDSSVLYPQPVPVKIEITNTGNSENIDSATFGWSINGEIQPSYTWIATSPLITGANLEIPVGSFSAVERTNIFDIIVWIESVNGTKDSVTWNDTAKASIKVLFTGNNLRISSIEPLVPDGVLCTEDYTPLKVVLENTGDLDYDFAANPVTFSIRVTNPEPFSLDTVISLGEIKSGETAIMELTDVFPIIVAGMYDIEVFLNSLVDTIKYDDTVWDYYISGRLALPIDEDFSSTIPTEFTVRSNNASCQWQIIPQGIGADTIVEPQFGTGMLAFTGTPGSMATLSTRQMDLSQTIQPALSFWYFHDTIPCEDYTDVRITIDGGTTYKLYSLSKYNPVHGWKQYSADLPAYAINQCVILVFEAMEKSRSGDVSQYIDRILITARQDIAVAEILTSPLTVCDLGNKDLKVVMQNRSNPVLNYVTNPTTLTLEIKETGQTYDTLLNSNSLGSFASDTITLATGFNFAVGTYTLKAYFSSVLDVDRNNDTLVSSIVINPALSVQVQSESTSNCLAGELTVHPSITINNTGNMDLSDIDLTIQIDTGDNNPAVYALFREIYTDTILAGNSDMYTFASSYSVPWNARYDVRATVYLSCDSAMANATNMITECVDVKDLRIVSIDNPSGTRDNIGSSMQVRATLNNRSDGDIFNSLPVTYSVTNSQGIQTASSTENITVGLSETISHTFTIPYTVPNDTVYYITVYVESRDNYRNNDTMTIKRETNNVSVETLEGNVFTLGQNIPNPAKSTTRIDYSVPEAGEIVFHVQSVSGQLLYSKTIEAASGKNSLEFSTNTLAAGIYFYSIEYKGQRLIKRMSVQK
jgi:hypothetical protein